MSDCYEKSSNGTNYSKNKTQTPSVTYKALRDLTRPYASQHASQHLLPLFTGRWSSHRPHSLLQLQCLAQDLAHNRSSKDKNERLKNRLDSC